MGEPGFAELRGLLDRGRPVVVQAHDFPDIDAVASAWGLAALLEASGFRAVAKARGRTPSRSLGRMLAELRIDLAADCGGDDEDQVVVVDGSPANGNVSPVAGVLVGIVDHHRCGAGAHDAPFVDLDTGLAACATRITEYWLQSGLTPSAEVATALLAGIQADTDALSGRASPRDFAAHSRLVAAGDPALAASIVRNTFDFTELRTMAHALAAAERHGGTLFLDVPAGQARELLAVLADFALRAEEIDLVIVAESSSVGAEGSDRRPPVQGCADLPEPSGAHVSVRSRRADLSANTLVRGALTGLGAGGGHVHAAGGFIPADHLPGEDELRRRFLSLIPPSKETPCPK